jgi:hypothetical protein
MAKQTPKELPVVTWLQAETLQALYEGHTAESIRVERRARRDTFYSHTRGLRQRGLITTGKQGQKGSVKALVKPRDFLIAGETQLDAEWLTQTVLALAKVALQDETACPIVADALQDAGCDDSELLDLLRNQPPESVPSQPRRAYQRATIDPRMDFLSKRTRLLQRIVN